MKTINLQLTNHTFEKVNLTTIKSKGRLYDLLKCSQCGLTGKRYGISEDITIDGRASYSKINSCPKAETSDKIKIINCRASGNAFSNITPGSIHEVITPPKGYKQYDKGVWVYGNGEPVKVLFDEFNILTDN